MSDANQKPADDRRARSSRPEPISGDAPTIRDTDNPQLALTEPTLPFPAPSSAELAATIDLSGGVPHPSELPLIDGAVYVVGGELARGGIGRILRARDTRLRRPVAVKELL